MPPVAVIPSVLDRLLDPGSMGAAARGAPETAVIEAVRRDLEDLLNTRRPADDLSGYPELGRSVFAYGIPELVSRRADTSTEREALGRLLAEAIAANEPRLRAVKAVPISDPGSVDRTLRFRISAVLRLEPSPGVEFETVVKLSTGQASVVNKTTM